MCGLVGGISMWDDNQRDIFTTLLMNNVVRGPHSTGVLGMYTISGTSKDAGNYYATRRSMLPSSAFIFDDEYKWMLRQSPKFLAGHSRFATKGQISEENCHPFETGKIIGMHNGTIHGSFEGSTKHDTDSEALFSLINKYDLKKALDIVHKEANSVAYAIVYYDRRDQTVNIIRNDQRPLCFARHKTLPHRIYWSSESLMLSYALMRANVHKDFEIELLKPGTLIKMHPYQESPENRVEFINDFYEPPKKTYLPVTKSYARDWKGEAYGYTPKDYSNYRHNQAAKTASVPDVPKRSGGFTDITTYLEQVQKEEDEKNKTTKDKIVSALDKQKRKDKEYIFYRIGTFFCNEVQIEDALKKGCMICDAPSVIVNDNLKHIRFLPDQGVDHVCRTCYDKLGPQNLGLTYGLFNLESPKLVEKKTEH